MNREQAVEIIERHIDNNIASGSLVEQALSMAIDALKAQLSKEGATSDLISRQAAIDALDKRFDNIPMEQTAEILMLRKDLRELPPAQPERKKGEWIEISSINHTYKCSECGRLLVNVADGRNNVSKHYPYCHCGADMKGGSNE